jgi:hypothetical protein
LEIVGRKHKSKKLKAILLTLALLLTGSPAYADDALGSWGITSVDSTGVMYENDILLARSPGGSYVPCQGGLDACSPDVGFMLVNTLVPCEAGGVVACIKSVSSSLDGAAWVEGKRLGERVQSWPMYAYPARPELGFGASHGPNLYQFQGISSDNGDLFEVAPRMQASAQSGKAISIDTITTRVQSVRKNVSGGRSAYVPPRPGLSGDDWLKSTAECLDGQHLTNECWLNDSQGSPIFFRVELSLPSAPDGWVSGRVFNPTVKFAKDLKNTKLPISVLVSGASVIVPMLAKTYFAFNPDEKAKWALIGPTLGSPWRNDSISRGLAMNPLDLDMFLKGLSHDESWDESTAERTEWVANLSWHQQLVLGSNCRQAGFEGFIGSNALVYESNLPIFNPATKEMTYRVASPHLRPGGSVQFGAYSLLISESLARCIWRLDAKVARLSLAVTSEAGESKSATTTLTLKDGLLRFEATGFTFSQVKLKAKIATDAIGSAVQTEKVPRPTTLISLKKTTITCVKGKLTKKVTAVGPKCPAGYKKK